MMRMPCRLAFVLAGFLATLVTGPIAAQDLGAAYIQIEAHRDRETARAQAAAFALSLERVTVFAAPGGWTALAIGPFPSADAARAELRRLRAAGLIPGDSFLTERGDYRAALSPAVAASSGAGPADPPPPPAGPTVDPAAQRQETLAEARAAERALTRPERQDIQRALAWDGHYAGPVDGVFGRGTRAAIEAWQGAAGRDATGVLSRAGRAALLSEWRGERARLGLQEVTEPAAGIRITLPLGLVGREAVEPPFVRYGGPDGVSVLLISQPGGAPTLGAWFDIVQSLDRVPLNGPRRLDARRFTVEGQDRQTGAYAEAILAGDWIKGFVITWPAALDDLVARALPAMKDGFQPLDGVGFPRADGSDIGADRLAAVDIRRPERAASGVYVDANGHAVTLAATVNGCARVTLDHDVGADIVAADGPLALLRPTAPLAPMAVARPGPPPARGSDLVLAGYPWGGRLTGPSVNAGRLSALAAPGAADRMLIEMATEAGEAGAPLLDAQGRLAGVLILDNGPRRLPPDTALAVPAARIAALLAEAGVAPPRAPQAVPDGARALADHARGMAVLVSCWN